MGLMEEVVVMPALLFVVPVAPVYKWQMNWILKELDKIQISTKSIRFSNQLPIDFF